MCMRNNQNVSYIPTKLSTKSKPTHIIYAKIYLTKM